MTKRNYPNRPNLRKMSKHGGGLIGWIKHKVDMYRFNRFIQKFATAKKGLKSEYESFNAETDFYERDALRKAELVSDYLVQSKVNSILELQDLSTPPFDTSPILKRGVIKDKKVSAKKIKEIRRSIKSYKEDLRIELTKSKTDDKKIDSIMTEITALKKSALKSRVNSIKNLQKILKPEQKKKMKKHLILYKKMHDSNE